MSSFFGGQTNAFVFLAVVAMSIFNFFALRKEFRISSKTLIFGVLPVPLMIAVYMVALNGVPMGPLWLYLLIAGLILGVMFGVLTRVYQREQGIFGRRSRIYLFLWLLTVILTQALSQTLGTAMVGLGLTLMFFSMGTALSQHLLMGSKAGKARRLGMAAASTLILVALVASVPTPSASGRGPAYVYYEMALDSYSIGNMGQAIEYAHKVVANTNSPGTQAKGYMLIWMAGGGEHYADLAHQGVLNSGQLKNVSGEGRTAYATAVGLGIIHTIENWQYRGVTFPDDANIIRMPGATPIFSHDLIDLWEDMKRDLGIANTDNALLAPILSLGDQLASYLANSQPLDPDDTARAGIIASAAMVLTGLINLVGAAAVGTQKMMDAPLGDDPDAPSPPEEPASSITMPDGRTYHSGQTYTFDDGAQYVFTGDDFEKVRDLEPGEPYVNVDGDQRIWTGSTSWRQSDWEQQQQINAQWDQDFRQRNQDLEQKYQDDLRSQELARQMQQQVNNSALSDLQDLRRRLITDRLGMGTDWDMLDRVNDAINRQLDSGQADVDTVASLVGQFRSSLDSNQNTLIKQLQDAQNWADRMDRYTRSVEMVKYLADKSFEVTSYAFGPAGVKMRAGYKLATGVAGGVGQATATGDVTRSLMEGTASGLADAGKVLLTDRIKTGYGQKVADWAGRSYDTVTSTIKEGYQGYRDGSGVLRGAGRGLGLGLLDAAVDFGVGSALDKILPNIDLPTQQYMYWDDGFKHAAHFKHLSMQDARDSLSQILFGDGPSNMSTQELMNILYKGIRDKMLIDGVTKSTQNLCKMEGFQPGIFS